MVGFWHCSNEFSNKPVLNWCERVFNVRFILRWPCAVVGMLKSRTNELTHISCIRPTLNSSPFSSACFSYDKSASCVPSSMAVCEVCRSPLQLMCRNCGQSQVSGERRLAKDSAVVPKTMLSWQRRCCRVFPETVLSCQRWCCLAEDNAVFPKTVLSCQRWCCLAKDSGVMPKTMLSCQRQCCHAKDSAVLPKMMLSC